MTDIQEANKRRLSNEEDSEGESSSKRPRYSPNNERSRSSSHSKRHKSRREGDEERRSRKRHRHRREEKTESSSSKARTSKRRSSSRERTRRKYRRSSHSREKDATNNFNTFNGRSNSFRERSPRENYVARRCYSPPARYRDRSRSPRKNHYERDREYDELYEKDDYSAASRNSRGYPALKREIQDLLRVEHHHLAYEGEEDSNGDIQGVEWCYQYLDPAIRGHITGGRAILHHRCRQCNRICLHLLGTYGTGKRMCLGCAARERGWREDEVPLWYFHKPGACQHCRRGPRQGYYNNY